MKPSDFSELLRGGTPIDQRLDQPLIEYWRDRIGAHFHDSYLGVPLLKLPEDLRVYEHLLWDSRPEVVIELGTQNGGSALWFRDRLASMARYGGPQRIRVISVDLDQSAAAQRLATVDPAFAETITLLEADVLDDATPARVAKLVPDNARCLVVEDAAHTYECTMAALEGFARFVGLRGYFVVEDGCVDVDAMRLGESWPRGVIPAVTEWLESPRGTGFRQRRELEAYVLTSHPCGFLQRVA